MICVRIEEDLDGCIHFKFGIDGDVIRRLGYHVWGVVGKLLAPE